MKFEIKETFPFKTDFRALSFVSLKDFLYAFFDIPTNADSFPRLKPVDVFMWMKIFDKIGDLANNAERMGNRLRLMLSKA